MASESFGGGGESREDFLERRKTEDSISIKAEIERKKADNPEHAQETMDLGKLMSSYDFDTIPDEKRGEIFAAIGDGSSVSSIEELLINSGAKQKENLGE